MMENERTAVPCISIGVRAWNEEAVIRKTLESLFQQSLFEKLAGRNEHCEVLCIPNGCTDRTPEIAAAVFASQKKSHPFSSAFSCRVVEVKEAGRNHTWNLFVHSFSHPEARFLFSMDSDIVFDRRETLFNMYAALLNDPSAQISSDRQIKDISLKKNKSLLDRISLATTDMTRTIQGQITGQLYCIRAGVARRLHLPKDLGAPDDGFIKAVVCTDFFNEPLDSKRIVLAENASHVFEAYTAIPAVMNNQKRQMIGQTIVHVLIEHLKTLPPEQRSDLARTLRGKEQADPDWLKRLIDGHLRKVRFFWQLFPGVLSFRFKRWWKMVGIRRLTHFPAAVAGFMVTSVACLRAYRHLKRGRTHYWPKAKRDNIKALKVEETARAYPKQPQAANG